MSEANTQAVVDEAEPLAQPNGDAAPNAQEKDDLDTLLNDPVFSSGSKAGESQPKPEQPGTTTDTKAPDPAQNSAVAELFQRAYRQDMDKTINQVRGKLDAGVFDDTLVEAWLDAQARQDPRLQNAWLNRHSNPKAFEKVVEGLGRNFSKKYGNLPDKAATEDREVVAAAVRGASTKAPEGKAPDFSGLSNAEYRDAVKKNYGFDPGVG